MSDFVKNSKKIKQNLIEKHGYICCQLCNRSNSYTWEVHHIVYRSEKPKHKHLNSLRNLILLCKSCHIFLHQRKSNRAQLMEERNLKDLFKD